MDTQTVLDIIKMIDRRLKSLTRIEYDHCLIEGTVQVEILSDTAYELKDLRDHLQDYIEARVSAMENQTVE